MCQRARELGGPDHRKRSSLLINDDLLIDLGPDIMSASFMHGVALDRVRYWLQTHSHSDHFDPSHLITRLPEYGVADVPPLGLFASAVCLTSMSAMLDREWAGTDLLNQKSFERLNLTAHPVETFGAFAAAGYRIIAFPSDHDPASGTLLYAIQTGGRTVFYGVDTPSLPEKTWQAFHDMRMQFDVVILDHTYGDGVGGTDHLNAGQFAAHVRRLRVEGLLAEGARVFATHISHEGNPAHAELVARAREHGYEVAYDGLVIEV